MRILLTGATGFLGSQARLQLLGHSEFEIFSWDRSLFGDLTPNTAFNSILESIMPDAVLHFAWASINRPNYESAADNFDWPRITESLIEACYIRDIWFIGIGSGSEEIVDDFQQSPYIEAKRQVLRILNSRFSGSSWSWIRPSYIFSLEAERPRLVKGLRDLGDEFRPRSPDSLHDFLDIDDFVSALPVILHKRIFGTIDVCSGHMRSVQRFIECVHVHDGRLVSVGSSLSVTKPATGLNPTLSKDGWSCQATDAFFGDLGNTHPPIE